MANKFVLVCIVLAAVSMRPVVTDADRFNACFEDCHQKCEDDGHGEAYCELKCDADCGTKEAATKFSIV
ncbi:putative inactive purple acid phosphatase 29-like [Hibiscus syriacus]|uniref:Inactive purple acid phosphatase 29-like n=1 Tax=Hibiscus syriacus TaxID=106335 RepID=A0A6A2XM34_HIBSY|nr:putative inactive purple acid phosphatase 29-like [Hibiscus syriacus]